MYFYTTRIGENPPEDWVEDSEHENGRYQCRCAFCKVSFVGYKRRVMCKVCYDQAAPKQMELF